MPSYIVITPVKDEEDYLPGLIECFRRLDKTPLVWYLVDDGSADNSNAIIESFVSQVSWCKLISMPRRAERIRGRAVVQAIMKAYEDSKCLDYEYIVKLDADISFRDDVFDLLISKMTGNPNLGIGGPELLIQRNGELQIDRILPKDFVRGAMRIYRSSCFISINGLVNRKGWDGIDQVKAKMMGWEVERFTDIKVENLREQGAATGFVKAGIENGRGSYFMGSLFFYMLYESYQYGKQKPYVLKGIFMIIGFLTGFLLNDRIKDENLVSYVQTQHNRKLKLLFKQRIKLKSFFKVI